MSERIQKALATAGVASRRAVEEMIAEGRVTVNGRPAELGQKVDHNDHVRVDGRGVVLSRKAEPIRVLLYRKKVGELVTREDPEGRRTVFRKLPELETGRWIAIGRLDVNTSGLLLLTNNGDLAQRLMHPSFEMVREYAVRVLGTVDAEILQRLKRGVMLEDGMAHFESIRPGQRQPADDGDEDDEKKSSANSWWQVTVKQGRNRVVRRLFESQNLQVSRLMRVSYGPITLGRGIKAGTAREADAEELQALLEAVKMAEPKAPAPLKTSRRHPSDPTSGRTAKPAVSGKKPAPRKTAAGGKPAARKTATREQTAQKEFMSSHPAAGKKPAYAKTSTSARPTGGKPAPRKAPVGKPGGSRRKPTSDRN